MDRRASGLLIVAVLAAACGPTTTTGSSSTPTSPASSAAPSISSPSASVVPSPTAPAQPVTFTSPLYGYTITLPHGWSTTPAAFKWDGIGAPGHDSSMVDQFSAGLGASLFAFAAPTRLDLAGYANDVIGRNARYHGDTCPPAPEVNEATTVGGVAAAFLGWNCGILINIVATVDGGIGYQFVMRDPAVQQATDANDRKLLDDMLATVKLP